MLTGAPGTPQLLALLIVVLTCRLLFDAARIWFQRSEQKEILTDSAVRHLTEALQRNTNSVIRLDERIHNIESQLVDLPRIKAENRRMIKFLAGDRWAEARKAAADDSLD
jgi:hypothetical protein